MLVEVRKPGRPLSSCPHPSGSCSCERVVINYTIPKSKSRSTSVCSSQTDILVLASECGCPSERAQTISSITGASNRVQKSRSRKLTNSITPSSLDKAIKASQDAEPDSSSLHASTPTHPSFPPSERSGSNEASAPSSASSTPRILPSPSRKQSYGTDFQLPNADASSDSRPTTSNSEHVSDCCKPKLESIQLQGGNCCGNKAGEPSRVLLAKKSCCSGPGQPKQTDNLGQASQQANGSQAFGNFPPLQQQGQFHHAPYGVMNPMFNYNLSVNHEMSSPFGFNTPIYNHIATGYQQPPQVPNVSTHNGTHHSTEHNCHCGDGCSCFGCAAHPNNATMTEYIRVMHQYMSTGGFGALPPPIYDIPTYPHHLRFGAEAAQNMNFNQSAMSPRFTPGSAASMPFSPHPTPVIYGSTPTSIPEAPVNLSAHWQQTNGPSIQSPPTADAQFFKPNNTTQEMPLSLKTEVSASSPTTAFADSPCDGKDEDTPTLSPSSYFWQELVLPGCNDATGTCQCGDGCTCIGCLTHGGHNGVPLDAPINTEQDTIVSFYETNPHTRDTIPNGTPVDGVDSPFQGVSSSW